MAGQRASEQAKDDADLDEDETLDMRRKLKAHIQVLQLKRKALSVGERRAADAAVLTLHRAARQTASRVRPDAFPLRDVEFKADEDTQKACEVEDQSDPNAANAILDCIFRETAPGPCADTVAQVPDEPGRDDHAVADLPGTRKLVEGMASASPMDRLPPINEGDPYSLPFREGARFHWKSGTKQWGATLDPRRMAKEDAQDLRRLLYKELRLGSIRVASSSAAASLLTPVFVVRSESGKLRLVHDLRPLNARLRATKVRYESVRDAVAMRERFAMKLDLAAAFKHVAVDGEAERAMAFRIGDAVVRWTRLPFGMTHSPEAFQAALAPVVERLRKEGIRMVVYVDDLLVAARDAAKLDEAAQRVISALRQAGWRVAPDKVQPWAHDRIVFLGVLVDLQEEKPRMRVAPSKAEKLAAMARRELGRERSTLSALQKVAGLLAFFLMAVPTVGLAWRSILGATTEAQGLPGRHVWVRGGLRAELEFWAKWAPSLPFWPSPPPCAPNSPGDIGLATDASADGAGAVWWTAGGQVPDLAAWTSGSDPDIPGFRCRAFKLPDEVKDEASATRELFALEKAITDRFGPVPTPPDSAGAGAGSSDPVPTQWIGPPTSSPARPARVIRWFSDSTAAVAALSNWRSGSPAVTRALRSVLALCYHHALTVAPQWVSRQLGWIPAADYLSRVIGRRAQAEWSLPPREFARVCGELRVQPTLDAYASRANAKCADFRSRFPEPGSSGDACSAPWPKASYAYPPWSQLGRGLDYWRDTAQKDDVLLLLAPLEALDALPPQGTVIVRSANLDPGVRLVDTNGRAAHAPPPPMRFVLLRRVG